MVTCTVRRSILEHTFHAGLCPMIQFLHLFDHASTRCLMIKYFMFFDANGAQVEAAQARVM